MFRRLSPWVACAALVAFASPSPAQQAEPGQKVVVTYTTLGMNQLLDGPIVEVGSDATNRVWAVAPGRVSAALGSVRAPLFPIDVADTPLLPTARFSSVSFGVPVGNATDGEHFFLGSSVGIAWGRLSSTVEHKPRPLVVSPGTVFPPDDDPNDVVAIDVARDPARREADWLWAATSGGLVLWDLSQSDPTSPGPAEIYLDLATDGPIQDVAVAPWGEALAVEGGDRLWRVDLLGIRTLVRDLTLNPIPGAAGGVFLGITFDRRGNLWAITSALSGGHPQILKFESDAATNDPPTGFTGVVGAFPLNPFVGTGTGAPAGFLPTDIAVDRFTGRVWVTTRSDNQGAMGTAYFQDPLDPAGNGDLQTDPAVNGWGVVTSTFDRHTTVHADASGNAWFGMAGVAAASEALNGYLVRLLTLDKSRYLGADSGVATLLDLTLVGAGSATLTIAVGGDSREFNSAETAPDSGLFLQTFQIVPADAPGGTGDVFLVSSSATDVPVTATYEFTDANSQPQQLVASGSWANIVPFEDDLLVGGKCFLRFLGW